jgi:hypothetical protein
MTELQDIDHTHPYTDEPFVESFRRGQLVADGGETDATEEADDTMEDVAHTSPNEGANRTFERGREGRDETV